MHKTRHISLLAIVALAFTCARVSADPLEGIWAKTGEDESLSFVDGRIKNQLTLQNGEDGSWSASYTFQSRDGISFIVYSHNGRSLQHAMLFSKDVVFIQEFYDSGRDFIGFTHGADLFLDPFPARYQFSASSFLQEAGRRYDAKNLADYRLTHEKLPWVEGVPGPGIGQKIFFPKGLYLSDIYISNGFVDPLHPEYYLMNCRVKKIRLTDVARGFEKIVDLIDTPNPQRINISEKLARNESELVIEILDVYKGSKYEDTCLNWILCQNQ